MTVRAASYQYCNSSTPARFILFETMSYSSPPLAQRRVQIGSEKGSTPKKVHYFDKDGAPSEIESASPLRGAPLKGALKGSSGSSAGGRPTTQEPTARRFSVCNILKFLALFKSKSLLQVPLYYILKESLLSGEDKLLAIFAKYDLAVLAEERNMLNLQILFEKIEQFARSKVEEWLGNYYGEDELMESHHISNNSSMQGTALEKQERSTSLIYGEVEFESFSKIMDIATTGLKGQVKFTDLGSGTGKACFWVALTTSFKEIYGIEILSELHIKAMKTLHALRTEGSTPQPTPTDLNSKDKDKDSTDCGIIPILPLNCDLCFIEGSFLRDAFDWSDSDLVFANR